MGGRRLFLFFLFSSFSLSYQFTVDFQNGAFWSKFPIDLYISEKDEDRASLLFRHLTDAANDWENSLGRNIWNVKYGNESHQNQVKYSFNFQADVGKDPYGTLAVAYRVKKGAEFQRTGIVVNGEIPDLLYDESLLRQTLLHELGHTIGLGHSDRPAIMGAVLGSVDYISSDDSLGLREAHDLHIHRQENGSTYTGETKSEDEVLQGMGCGSISIDGGNPGSGPLSYVLGVMMLFLIERSRVFPSFCTGS